MHYGVDLSSNNSHPINYAEAVADLKARGGGDQPFVIVKATQGTTYVNPDFQEDIQGFHTAGAAYSAYLMDQGNADPATEETVFHRMAGAIPQWNDDELPMGNNAYAQHCSALVVQNPAAGDYLNQSEENAGFPPGAGYWEANPNGIPGKTNKPALVHQYGIGPVAGVGDADLDVWLGPEEMWQKMFANVLNPTPPPNPMLTGCVAVLVDPKGRGYWLVQADGGVFTHPQVGLPFFGSAAGMPKGGPVVGGAATPDGAGYWLCTSIGEVFAYGSAGKFGGAQGQHLNKPVVGMAASPDGNGYILAAGDGGVFTFGDVPFEGSAGAVHLNQPVVGIAITPDGKGYALAAGDGGIFTFGDQPFEGSAGGTPLNKPVVGISASPDGKGYWLAAADGGVFTFGDSPYFGSTGGVRLNQPVVGISRDPSGKGYYLVAADGGIFTFGDAQFFGAGQ